MKNKALEPLQIKPYIDGTVNALTNVSYNKVPFPDGKILKKNVHSVFPAAMKIAGGLRVLLKPSELPGNWGNCF